MDAPQGLACFAGDPSDQEQKLVGATQFAPAADLLNQKLDGTAWRPKPSWYIVANNDRTVQPELRFVVKRMGATIYEVDSNHIPHALPAELRDRRDPYRRQRRLERCDQNGLTTVERNRVRELPIKIEDLLA